MSDAAFMMAIMGLLSGYGILAIYVIRDHRKWTRTRSIMNQTITNPQPVPPRDFDPATGKLVSVHPETKPFLANPAGLAPTGSAPGRLAPSDAARSVLTGLGLYGLMQLALPLLNAVGMSAQFLGPHGPEIAAVAVAVAHLLMAYQSDNTPRPSPRVP